MLHFLYVFGSFELDPSNFWLRFSGRPVQLQRVPLDLLLALVERKGDLVSREEIVEKIWGKDVFLDVDSAIGTAIRKIRRALGDDSTEPQYIETIPTKGYRFIAAVERKAIGAGREVNRARPTIAVLPLFDLSDSSEDYFNDGMTEEILTHLGRLHPSLGVIARTSVMGYKGTQKSIHEIGRELGADYVLEGSVRRNAGRIRIAVQLIETEGQTHLWAESYERDFDDLFRLQDRLAYEIACQISVKLKADAPASSPSAFNVCREAYEAYLTGRFFWNKRTAPGVIKSMEHFQEAIRLEPTFASAHAGLADAYIFQGIQGVRAPADVYPKAEEAALKALAIDNSLAAALCSLASIQNFYHWNWTTAEPLFRRAIELNPSYAIARFFYAGVLSEMGRFEEAFRHIEVAKELDPLSMITAAFSGYIQYRARQYERAMEAINQAIELEPHLPTAHWYKGMVHGQQGEWDDAIQAMTEAVKLSMGQPIFLAALGHAFGKAERTAEATGTLQKLTEMSTARYVSPLEIAVVHIGLDDRAAAFEYLEEACEKRVTRMRALRDPFFDSLRSDSRYLDLLARAGLPVAASTHP